MDGCEPILLAIICISVAGTIFLFPTYIVLLQTNFGLLRVFKWFMKFFIPGYGQIAEVTTGTHIYVGLAMSGFFALDWLFANLLIGHAVVYFHFTILSVKKLQLAFS